MHKNVVNLVNNNKCCELKNRQNTILKSENALRITKHTLAKILHLWYILGKDFI